MEQKKKGLGIQGRMLIVILQLVFIALNLVSLVSGQMASNAINEQTEKFMSAALSSNIHDMNATLEEVRLTAENLSIFVGDTYTKLDMAGYADVFTETVLSNELIRGAGIWFEPSVYTGDPQYAGEKYVGPYWYRDGNTVVEDWEYSNAGYDYFVQEYYVNASKQTDLRAVITDPYFDPASNSIMATCSAPIFDEAGKYLGCITVDMSLETISEIVSAIKVGKADESILLTSDGTYIYNTDSVKVARGMRIDNDPDSISSIAAGVVSQESGVEKFAVGKAKMTAYFATIPEVNWKLVILMPDAELNEATTHMMTFTIPICILSLILCVVFVVLFSGSIARPIRQVERFADELAQGNFAIEDLKIRRKDEIGAMGASLNDMFRSNSEIIRNISNESNNISDAASTLGAMSEELSAEFSRIQSNVEAVNGAMMSSSAATQQVSASVTEVNTSVQKLAAEAEGIETQVREINARADKVQKDSKQAYESAIKIVGEREKELREATAKAAVVSEIENLANAISDIASEIDLLSLNASIEAARAGEAGRGFAVVAQQINKLATETAEAVKQIQGTVGSIQDAFSDLASGSNKLLTFVTETVAPDYDKFNNIGKQYGEDADLFGQLSIQILDMTESIRNTMDEVNAAVQNIAESTQDTAAHSTDVTDSIGSVSEAVESVAELATNQQFTAQNLTEIVRKFRFE